MDEFYVLKNKIPVAVKTIEEWGKYLSEIDRHVGLTEINSVTVSTVFLGINHQYQSGPPLLFETMIFGGNHDGYQERCSTYEQAENMHELACSLVRSSDDRV